MKRTKSILIPISLYYAIRFMSYSAFGAFIGIYYSDVLKFDGAQIGLLESLGGIIILFAQPLWGIVSDRSKYKNTVLYICLIAASATIWFLPLSGDRFILLALALGTFNFFQCAINPISDAITLELSTSNKFKFSHIRTIGSLGFALMAYFAGRIFENNIMYMFPVFSILMFSSLLLALFYPPVEGHQSKGKQKVNILVLFKDKRLIIIFSYALIISTAFGFFNSFHSLYSKSLGISTGIIGLGVSIGSFSQFPFMMFFDRLYKRFGIINILMFSGLIQSIRWFLFAFALSEVTLPFIWTLHGFTFIVFYLCMAQFVSDNVVKELKASGQMMNAIILSGLSRIIGSSVGGFATTYIGISGVFFVNSIICLVAVITFFIITKSTNLFNESQSTEPEAA
ncbi:PPP family 3-phenylpropionic acid transporter [Natranaerovirga pectinivora]|uniref:PPP family 3-phenylpropionic acid transporter n=1 Tax=Natranaerovirga pectinivora TaxID=682400 RepID=A0A4R3MJM9_9FIRM|nr:MFS transporter [Natranaerovirga pectinivora]TCT14330.1 PPP family 3-phenylpropionic acid transporter [Natranaerovirga pectinivora]